MHGFHVNFNSAGTWNMTGLEKTGLAQNSGLQGTWAIHVE